MNGKRHAAGTLAETSRRATLLCAVLLALLTLGSDAPPRVVEGEKRELANVRSVFVVTNDESCRSELCAYLEENSDLRVTEDPEDADAVLVLTTSIEREGVPLIEPGSCAPCQAQSSSPKRLDLETRKVVLSVLIPTGPNEYRRVFFTHASGGFGTNPDERVATHLVKNWKKWNRKAK